jgi:3-hydroxyacyl-CoA dehydrogenase
MKLLEVVRGKATAKDVLATVMKLAKKIKKTAVVRRLRRLHRQPHDRAVLAPGRLPAGRRRIAQQVDKAIEKFGFAMGPFRMGDLAGNDIGWAIRKRRYVESPI